MISQRLVLVVLIILLSLRSAPLRSQATGEWTAEQTEARRQEIIQRYRSLLERRPVEGPVLDRLLDEVGPGRSFGHLVADYEQLAAEDPDRFSYQMILGHLYKRSGDLPRAIDAYQRASALEPQNGLPWLALARALRDSGRLEEARAAFEQALSLTRDTEIQAQILFSLADIAFGQRDFGQAVGYFERIVAIDPRDVYIRQQLADTLCEYGQLEQALEQYQAIARMAGQDTRQRALNLGAMGDLLVELGRMEEAVERYRQAQSYVRRGTWLWEDLEARIIQAYRATGNLAALISQYEEQWRRPDLDQLRLLGQLYQEVGRVEEAVSSLRQAVRRSPRSVDARLDLIALLEQFGDWDEVIEQYETLVRYSDEAAHHFRLAEVQRQAGREQAAHETALQIQRRYRNSTAVLVQLADLYLRWGEREQARDIYHRLVELEPDNPDFLIALGEFQFMEGRREEALETWQRISEVVPDVIQARAMLAQVYAEHSMFEESISTFSDAVASDPSQEAILTSYAEVLEDARRFSTALEVWTRLSRQGSDSSVRSQARSRIIAIYLRQGLLRDRLPDYLLAFQAQPPDRESGYFLAEAYTALGNRENAELVLLALLETEGEDLEALLPLAALYEQMGRLPEAIGILEQVAELDPDWARDHHYHIAELSLRLFEEDQAIHHATRAVAANPNDPRGHARLGRIYLRMAQYDRAVTEFQEAVRLDRRGSAYIVDLAEVLGLLGRQRDADECYRQVVRYSRDPVWVARAGRAAIQIDSALGTLEQLLTEWESLVHRPQAQSETRELVVRLAERLVTPLAEQARGREPSRASDALVQLDRLSPLVARSLLPVLGDEDRNLAFSALNVLADLPAPDLALPLSRLLLDPDREMRLMAALALGRIGTATTWQPLLGLAWDEQPDVRAVAAWAMGNTGTTQTIDTLASLFALDPSTEVRAMAAVALGQVGDEAVLERLLAAVGSADAPLRRAILWALGAIADHDAADVLMAGLVDTDRSIRLTAAWSLGRLAVDERIVAALLQAFWTDMDRDVRLAAARTLRQLGSPARSDETSATRDRLLRYRQTRESLLGIEAWLDDLAGLTTPAMPPADPMLLVDYLETVRAVAQSLLDQGNQPVVLRVLEDLGAREEGMGLGLLTWGLEEDPGRRQVESQLAELSRQLHPTLVELVVSPEPRIRRLALRVLGRVRSPAGQSEVPPWLERSLADPVPEVRRQAALVMAEIGVSPAGVSLEAGLGDTDCLVRAAMAESLGRLEGESSGALLQPMLQTDRCILARGGAARGLALAYGGGAIDLISQALEGASPALRAEIAGALGLIQTARARAVLESLLRDPSPMVRAVAQDGLSR